MAVTDGELARYEQVDSPAEKAVGVEYDEKDYKLRPTEHAGDLPPEAGALARVLNRHEIRQIGAEYAARTDDAKRYQNKFRKRRRRMRIFAAVALLFGVGSLVAFLAQGYRSDFQLGLLAFHILGLIVTLVYSIRLDASNPRRKWREARGRAEYLRLQLFTKVVQASEPHHESANELPLPPLQLAYFRRYQLDVQIRYFLNRPKEIDRAVGPPLWATLFAVAAALAILAYAGLSALDLYLEQGWSVPAPAAAAAARLPEWATDYALLLVAASSAYAVFMLQSEPSEDRRNAIRYRKLGKNLVYIRDRGYEPVRRAVERGELEPMHRFVSIVHQRLRGEIEEWLSSDLHDDDVRADVSPTTEDDVRDVLAMPEVRGAAPVS